MKKTPRLSRRNFLNVRSAIPHFPAMATPSAVVNVAGSSDITASCTSVSASSPMMPCTLVAVTRKYSVRRIALSTVASSIAFFYFAPHAQSERASRRQNRTA